MGNFKQCPNGHYYDHNLPSCPYCSSDRNGLDRSSTTNLSREIDDYGFKTSDPVSPLSIVPNMDPPGYDTDYGPLSVGGSMPAHNDGSTHPPVFDTADLDKTHIVRQAVKKPESGDKEDSDPQELVVGWLVAVEGCYRGQSFELHHGYNYIGSKHGDIVLDKDQAISKEKNIYVLYSVKNNRFKVGVGMPRNPVLLNDDEIDAGSSVPLKAYDAIEMGESKFRFVPFCSEEFVW